jgi:hypothetical protein
MPLKLLKQELSYATQAVQVAIWIIFYLFYIGISMNATYTFVEQGNNIPLIRDTRWYCPLWNWHSKRHSQFHMVMFAEEFVCKNVAQEGCSVRIATKSSPGSLTKSFCKLSFDRGKAQVATLSFNERLTNPFTCIYLLDCIEGLSAFVSDNISYCF